MSEANNKVPGYPPEIFDFIGGSGSYVFDRSQVWNNFSLNVFRTTTPLTASSFPSLGITLLSLRDISPVRGIAV